MHRIDVPSATAENQFTEGSPTGGVPATTVAASWLNDLQENVCEVIEAADIELEKGESDQLLLAIQQLVSDGTSAAVPAGSVIPFAYSSAPSGWLKANGAAVSRTTYAALFAAVGTTFGAGNGTTTFNLPDLRGEFVRGWDDGRGIDTGRAIATSQKGSLQTLDSTITTVSITGLHNSSITPESDAKLSFGLDEVEPADYVGAQYAGTSGTAGNIATEPNNFGVMRPRNVSLLYCIKF